MTTSLALVHHANQYLITYGYQDREDLAAVIGRPGGGSGLAHILELHARHGIPLNLHISGTLLEAAAWHQPWFLAQIRETIAAGLVDLVGSCYGQNIMRFFGAEYNRKQLNEELSLYKLDLGVEAAEVKTFWPPERVWDTRRMAPALRDARLANGGYRYVLLDDRVLLSPTDPDLPRPEYDRKPVFSPDLYHTYEVEDGLGLVAFPIAVQLRHHIPPRREEDWQQVKTELEALLVESAAVEEGRLLAVYADDMEKAAGTGFWGADRPARYAEFLEWVAEQTWLETVKLSEFAAAHPPARVRKIETGTFIELANHFEAGEGYEKWYFAADWAPYRAYFQWAERRVREAAAEGGDPALLALAEKQLLVGNWETGWHTPPFGPHGNSDDEGAASPWARALTSHCRHAAVTARAAGWMRHKDGQAHASCEDLDNDGYGEAVLYNSSVYAAIAPRWGARVIAAFSVAGERGAMVVGNPCDDWHVHEELNAYIERPRNHPGCFADAGRENAEYAVEFCGTVNGAAEVVLVSADGVRKTYRLEPNSRELSVAYEAPEHLLPLIVECGLSPDYYNLLRHGQDHVREIRRGRLRGFANGEICACVAIPENALWREPELFGHGYLLRLEAREPRFELRLAILAEQSAIEGLDVAA